MMAFSSGKKIAPHVHDEQDVAFQAEHALVGMIEAGMAEGIFRRVDPKLASKSVWASLHGLTTLLVSMEGFPSGMPGSEHVTADAVIDFHTGMMLQGLKA